MITKIRKRDGRLVDYDITKIENAIAKAMMSLGDGEIKDCKKMARITELYLMERFEDNKIPTVEDIQDEVEAVLMKNGYEDVAKAYIIYRRDHEKIRNIGDTFLDYKETVDKYSNAYQENLAKGKIDRKNFWDIDYVHLLASEENTPLRNLILASTYGNFFDYITDENTPIGKDNKINKQYFELANIDYDK